MNEENEIDEHENKIVLKNAVVRKKNFLYYIDAQGNLCETNMMRGRKKRVTFSQ